MTLFSQASSECRIAGPAGALQAMLDVPADAAETTPLAVICHPHPPDGGSLNNKVVATLAKACVECKVIALRFNFRGVGASGGAYDGGAGELADCLAVIKWARQQRPQAPLLLAGFSFGAWVALKAAEHIPPAAMISIAPPVGFRDFSQVSAPACPWLAVQGENDEIVDPHTVLLWLERQSPKPQIIAMPETSHFFHGKLLPLRAHVVHFLKAIHAA